MKPVDQPVEHQARHRVGVLVVHAHARQRLLPLTVELLLLERGPPHDIRQQVEAKRQSIFHHQHVGHRQVAAGAGTQGAADGVDGIGNLSGIAGAGSLIQ